MSRQLPPCDHDECPPSRCLRARNANEQRLVGCDALVLPFDLALTRWSVMCIVWRDLAGDHPNLTAFLAGWGCRCIGAAMPEKIEAFRDSFRVGWKEADDQIAIERQRHNDQSLARRASDSQ